MSGSSDAGVGRGRPSSSPPRPGPTITPVVRAAAIVAVVGVVSAVIAMAASGYWLSNFTQAYCMVLAVLGCALLYGQLGLVSLCQWALVGVGGWITLRVHHYIHPPFIVSLLAGGVGASLIGMIWGLPALRMRGLYLALVTLMLAGAFQSVVFVTSFPVGGPDFLGQVGASGSERVMFTRPLFASTDSGYFLFVAVVTLGCIFLVEAHRRSKPGRAWALIRKNEQMARAAGVRVVFYKAWAFALSGFLCGVAGALLAGLFGQLDASAFPATDSIVIFIGTQLGGCGAWIGAFLGGLLVRFIPALLADLGIDTNVAFMVFGASLLFALRDPQGLGGRLASLAGRGYERWAQRQRKRLETPPAP
jgi:branched-chain amino acid transport system permease protein